MLCCRFFQKTTRHLCKVIKIMTTLAKNRIEMTAEREFAGFVLPFAAGIFLVTGSGLIRISHISIACTASFTLTALTLLAMLRHPWRKAVHMPAAVVLLGLFSGILAGFTSELAAIGSYGSSFGAGAERFSCGMEAAIDSIPFEDPRTNALIKALVTGERNDIPPSVTEAFRDSGASHILSLSGFHLGIIYGIIRYSLSVLGNGRKAMEARSVVTIALCGFYTLATGAGPSIVRAFLFILLGESARIMHRRQTTASLLMSSLLIQLALSPAAIRSVSFQLSYAAMAGIAYIYPWLRRFWPGKPEDDSPFTKGMRWIWNSASMSIACQLATGPLAYFYFDSFPKHFLLTNLIALPLTGLIIPLGLVVLVLHTLGICPAIMTEATEMLVQALSAALEIISTM